MSDTILVSRDGPVATVVLNNPDKLNALNRAAWVRLNDVMGELSAADDVRCIVVRGAGDKAFASGADISEFPAERANAAQARVYGGATAGALGAVLGCRHPTVAMILGVCTGGGLEIACACDLRISGESGRFGAPINRLGHAMAYPEMEVVRRVAGDAVVLELLLEGCILGAREAAAKGLLTRVVADEAVEEEAYAAARRIAEGAPLAARCNKRFVRRLGEPEPLTAAETDESYALCDSEDYREGLRAFLAKEKPSFRGR
jgi:enoyl-CoA hydratase/carnithine racemase